MAGGDNASHERQLFGDRRRTLTGFVACRLGLARVSLAGGRVGQAGLVRRCTATSVATDENRVVVGTDGGVFDADEGRRLGESFGAAAVGLAGSGRVLAADAGGRVLAWEEGWNALGEVAAPRRFDGELLAAGGGVYRVTDRVEPLGLGAVRDVAGEGPFAATDDGLYARNGEEWHREHDRPTAAVIAGEWGAHAVDDEGVLARVDGSWRGCDAPARPVDIAYGGAPCGITEDGTVLLGGGDGEWRSHPLGLRGVVEFCLR